MKKVFLFFATAIVAAGLGISCTDLSGIEGRIDTLEEKMASMINSVMALNENVQALQAFCRSGQTVKEIRQEGNVYTIVLGDGSVHNITVENGPVLLNVGIDDEGYWTLDGKRILSDGEPVKAVGEKGDKGDKGDDGAAGSDGEKGEDGAAGKTPIFGVDSEGYWTVKYDENEEPERITDENGGYVLAVGSAGGDSFFRSVTVEDGYLTIVLASDPDKSYRLPIEAGFRIEVSSDIAAILPGKSLEIPFEVVGSDASTRVFVEAHGGYEAVLKEGAVVVTAPEELPADGYVIIKAIRNSDSSYKAVCISFEAGQFSCVADVETVSKEGGIVNITVTSNIEYEVSVPADAGWLRPVPETKAVTVRAVSFAVDANEGAMRTALIKIVPVIGDAQEIRIVQYGADDVVFEDVDLASVAKFTVSGAAAGDAPVAMTQTLENEDVFAFYAELQAGDMYIGMYDGEDAELGAIVPAEGDGINAGQVSAFGQDFVSVGRHWTVPAAGKYRIVLNRATGEITIYDEATDLQPWSAVFHINNLEANGTLKTTITDKIYLYGDISWSGKAVTLVPSAADPQVLYYKGDALNFTRVNFKTGVSASDFEVIAEGKESVNISRIYTFAPSDKSLCVSINGGTNTAAPINVGEWTPMSGGSDWQRGQYFHPVDRYDGDTPHFQATKVKFILDLRNMRVKLIR